MKQIFINEEPTTYYITEDGKLFNVKTLNWLKGSVSGGYLKFSLRHRNKKYDKLAHRLVAEAYLENPKKLPLVNHIDGNKLNNCVDNLEWVSCLDNNLHAYKTGLKDKTDGLLERKKYNGDLPNELWKQYKNTTFMFSNLGRARNAKTNNILKGKITKDGYREWRLSIDGKKKSYLAHRIIYEVFIGELQENYVINHKDGNKLNNNIDNLEQITESENVIHAYYLIKTNPKIKQVGKYSLNDELLDVYPSCAEAARLNIGCKSYSISRVCNGIKNSHHGYKWKYINKD